MDQRLRGEDLADRGCERRPAGLAPDLLQLLERLEQAVVGGVGAQVRVERGDEARRQVVLGGADGDPRAVTISSPMCSSTRSDASHRRDVDAGAEAHPASAEASDSPATRWSERASG